MELNPWIFKAELLRIVDADTIELLVDQGFSNFREERFRISDYDAPESYRPRNDKEKAHGESANKRAGQLLQLGDTLLIETYKTKADVYGRYSAKLWVPNKDENGKPTGTYFNYAERMIAEGYQKTPENY